MFEIGSRPARVAHEDDGGVSYAHLWLCLPYFETTGGFLRSIASLGGDIRDEFENINGVDLAPDG